jgi:hypothetical protein
MVAPDERIELIRGIGRSSQSPGCEDGKRCADEAQSEALGKHRDVASLQFIGLLAKMN